MGTGAVGLRFFIPARARKECLPVRMEREIAILKDLVRATCRSADLAAAAIQAPVNPCWTVLLEQIREDRRLLLVDLVRCLLLRGLPVPAVRQAMTEVLGPVEPESGFALLRFDLEIAERKLELALRRVLGDTLVSTSTLELLSLHYLRLQLRLKALEGPTRIAATPGTMLPAAFAGRSAGAGHAVAAGQLAAQGASLLH